jgi:hypothetical protein
MKRRVTDTAANASSGRHAPEGEDHVVERLHRFAAQLVREPGYVTQLLGGAGRNRGCRRCRRCRPALTAPAACEGEQGEWATDRAEEPPRLVSMPDAVAIPRSHSHRLAPRPGAIRAGCPTRVFGPNGDTPRPHPANRGGAATDTGPSPGPLPGRAARVAGGVPSRAPHAAPTWPGWASPTAASTGRWKWSCAPPAPDGRIAEVPVPYAPRTGRSKVTGTLRGTVRAVRDMAAVLDQEARR